MANEGIPVNKDLIRWARERAGQYREMARDNPPANR
jgi:hypothetical protein